MRRRAVISDAASAGAMPRSARLVRRTLPQVRCHATRNGNDSRLILTAPKNAMKTASLIKSLATLRPHGTRTRYQQGCKCFKCRLVIAQYQRELNARKKSGEPPNPIVSANKAKKHLRKLSRQGVGIRTVAEVTDIHRRKICDIRSGRKQGIRAECERIILSITAEARADGARVPSAPTRSIISRLKKQGLSESELSVRLGYSDRTRIARKPYVTAKTAMKVEKLYRRMSVA